MMHQKIKVFFEFKVPLFSYFILSAVIICLYFFNFTPQPLTTFNSQIGGMVVFVGFLLRTLITSTSTHFDKTKITGIYAVCRQPLLLSQLIIFIGFNIIMLNIFFVVLSLLTFLANDYLLAKKYDKILSHYHKNTWKNYTKQTNFVIPTLSNINNVLTPQTLNVKKHNKNHNTLIFLLIYVVLIEIATISNL